MRYTVREISEMADRHHGAVRLAGAELGVESFGLQLMEFPAGYDGYPEHDHASDRMEEVYVCLGGSGEMMVDGESVRLDERRMLRVAPEARRKLVPGPEGIRVLAIGSTIGADYVRPGHFTVGAGA